MSRTLTMILAGALALVSPSFASSQESNQYLPGVRYERVAMGFLQYNVRYFPHEDKVEAIYEFPNIKGEFLVTDQLPLGSVDSVAGSIMVSSEGYPAKSILVIMLRDLARYLRGGLGHEEIREMATCKIYIDEKKEGNGYRIVISTNDQVDGENQKPKKRNPKP